METAIFITTLLICLLGVAYVKGYDMVKSRSAEHLPQFCLTMTAVRLVLILTTAAIVIMLTDDKADARQYALYTLTMYVLMMVTTLWLRH